MQIKQLGLFCSFLFSGAVAIAATPLTLPEAEQLAIQRSPEIQRLQANKDALAQQAVADGQLPDPKLMAGVNNVPTSNFNLRQDDMTMMEVGLQQAFPPGHSLRLQSQRTQDLSTVEAHKKQEQTLQIRREVRLLWLDYYYWSQAKTLTLANQVLLKKLLRAVEAQYSQAQAAQTDVLQAQVELTRSEDKLSQIEQQLEQVQAALHRYIGQEAEQSSLSQTLPTWPKPPALAVLEQRLPKHPLLQVDSAMVQAGQDSLALAKEHYKPGYEVRLGYGIRQGRMNDGQKRSDMVGIQVAVDLPVFTGQRQDKRVVAGQHQLTAAALERQSHYLDLQRELQSQYTTWQRLTERAQRYQQHLLPEVKQNTKSSQLAYQHTTGSLSQALKAASLQLEAQLEYVQIQVDRAKARVALLYLEGSL